ncbi:sensor histidine kinase [Streptomyces sp. SBT349]|uniref:sensor histidine kinase n=1 Tax=Streptomyces sp. SBT349 TaxID=1580539 RepID=UPI00066EB39C|nr:sensor histidine kinase [Streptomyces sp. SBT349]
MRQRPQPGPRAHPPERLPVRAFRLWYGLFWALTGLFPPIIAEADEPGAATYWLSALVALLLLAYAVLETFPRTPGVRPRAFLLVLLLGLGAIACLRGAGASLLLVTLPHFWFFAGSPRAAIASSGAATALTVLGGAFHHGWDGRGGAGPGWEDGLLTGNALVSVAAYPASVLLGLLVHRFVEQHEQRAHRLSAELEEAQARLAEAHQRQGAADERERLAREIHDTLAQGFASIIVLAEAARSGLGADPGRSAQQLLSIERTARENFAEARVLVGSAPKDPQDGGIAPGSVAVTLRRTVDRFTEDTGLSLVAELPDVACDQRTRIALLRCAQESLANVRKHAGATTVGVVLARHPHGMELEITDDGRGFVVADSRGFGLDGMRRRLAELGGELTVTSSVGDGTRVLATIPVHGEE